jgi:hypothetical protein
LYFSRTANACLRSSGVKSMTSFSVTPCRSNGAGLVGKGCVGEVFSPGTVDDWGTGFSSMGQIGFRIHLIDDGWTKRHTERMLT